MDPTPYPVIWNIAILENSDMVIPVRLEDTDGALISTSGLTAEIDVREAFDSTPPLFTLTTSNGRISFGSFGTGVNAYNMELYIPASVTEPLVDWGDGVWACHLIDGSGQYRIWEGVASFSRSPVRT